MPNNIENFKHPEKQSASSSGEKQPSPSDFAAGKRHQGILKRKYNDIQDTDYSKEHKDIQNKEHGKKRKVTFGRDESIIIDSSLDKDIKIDYNDEETIFSEHLQIFKNTVKDISNIFEDLKQSLDPKEIYNRSGFDPEDVELMHDNEKEIRKLYNDSKQLKSEKPIEDPIDLILDSVEGAIEQLDKLQKLKREIE